MATASRKSVSFESAQAMWNRGTRLSAVKGIFSENDEIRALVDSGPRVGTCLDAQKPPAESVQESSLELAEEFVSELRRGELVAIGYHRCVKLNVRPTIVPERFLEVRYFDFRNESISAYEHTFQFVRVCYPRQKTKRNRGRPEARQDIILAMHLANFEWDTNFHERPFKKHYDIIRRRIKKMSGYRLNPTDRTIGKYYPEGLKLIEEMNSRRKAKNK